MPKNLVTGQRRRRRRGLRRLGRRAAPRAVADLDDRADDSAPRTAARADTTRRRPAGGDDRRSDTSLGCRLHSIDGHAPTSRRLDGRRRRVMPTPSSDADSSLDGADQAGASRRRRGARRHSSAGAARSASRSTTTCVIGTANARAPVTTPRSSQCDRPSGCVEMTISSAPNVRSASSIACSGSPSPTSPRPGRPPRRAARATLEPLLRLRAPSSSEPSGAPSCSAPGDDEHLRPGSGRRDLLAQRSPPTVSFATTSTPCSSTGALRRRAARALVRGRRHQRRRRSGRSRRAVPAHGPPSEARPARSPQRPRP